MHLPRPRRARQSRTFAKRKKHNLIFACLLVFVSLVSWIFSLSRLSKLDIFTISRIQVSGADPDIMRSAEAAALDSIRGDYLRLFSKSNAFLYPKGIVKDHIKNSSPKIQAVNVRVDSSNNLVVSVTEKTPAAVVCVKLPDWNNRVLSANDRQSCYFADDSGFIYGPASQFSEQIYKIYYIPGLTDNTSSANADSIIGMYATSTGAFMALQDFYDEVLKQGIKAEAVLIKENGEYELYIGDDSDTTVIYFNDSKPLADKLDNLISFWNSLYNQARAKGRVLRFDYIDLRYGENVFYRLI